MTTYNVDAAKLKDILLRFNPHQQLDLPYTHFILNEAYYLYFYELVIDFIFQDVLVNGLIKLWKEAPELLQTRMTDNIKSLFSATTRGSIDKMDNLFGVMTLSYKKKLEVTVKSNKLKNFQGYSLKPHKIM